MTSALNILKQEGHGIILVTSKLINCSREIYDLLSHARSKVKFSRSCRIDLGTISLEQEIRLKTTGCQS